MSLRKLPLLLAAALLVATITVGIVRAQGGTVADFTVQKNGGGTASLSAYTGQKAIVVIFVNPACAFTRLYQERLTALNSAYSSRGVQFMFVNVPINLDSNEGGGASLAIFSDEAGTASAALGVTKTSEAVVLQPAGGGFAVRYRGAIDDNPQVASGVQQHYLQQVLDNVLGGRPAGVADKRAAGCLIKR
ncbi:MAG: redoxin domain-containing protein [Hymenobacter sp.]|nr:MAG: redoxin domain-containing protein [Hymenobacter sp.]